MALETGQCRLQVETDGVGSPSAWTAYLDGTPGGSVLTNVQTLDFDTAYIRSNGANSQQWYTLENPVSPPTTETIVRVTVEAMVKSDDFYVGSCRLNLGIGADTVGGGTHLTYPNWTRISESFDLTPGASPVPFTWPDIDNIDIGITSLTVGGEVDCTWITLSVDYCNFTACPRCCCCCMCFTPIIRVPANAFEYDLGGGTSIFCPALVLPAPFCGFYFLGGCWFQYGASLGNCAPGFDPVSVATAVGGDGHTYSIRLVGASIVGSVLNPDGNCSLLAISFALWDDTTNSPVNTIELGPSQTTLTQCEPYHQSTIGMDGITMVPSGAPILSTSGTITIDCSGDDTGALPYE